MRSRVSWLLIGLVLFAIAAWFMSCAAFGWSSVWRSQHLLTAKRSRIVLVDPALANDPAVDAAKLTVVGPLANAIEPVENAPDAGQNATPPTPPTAFDHVERPATSKPLGFQSSFLVKTYRFSSLWFLHTPVRQISGHIQIVLRRSRQGRRHRGRSIAR